MVIAGYNTTAKQTNYDLKAAIIHIVMLKMYIYVKGVSPSYQLSENYHPTFVASFSTAECLDRFDFTDLLDSNSSHQCL